MSVYTKTLIETKQAESAQTTQYTAPASTRTIIDKFTATNVTGTVATLTVNLVPAAGSAGTANIVSQTKAIAPGDAYTFPEIVGHVLAAGDLISTLSNTAAALNIRASGREVS